MQPIHGLYTVNNRDTDEPIGSGFTEEDCNEIAINYLSANPDVTLIIEPVVKRYWKCKTTGKIRTDNCEDISII